MIHYSKIPTYGFVTTTRQAGLERSLFLSKQVNRLWDLKNRVVRRW